MTTIEDQGRLYMAALVKSRLSCKDVLMSRIYQQEMMKMIQPTIGRVILVHRRHANPASSQPEPALICYVHSDRNINVGGFNAHGQPFSMISLPLVQPEDDVPAHGVFAAWMPFQISSSMPAAKAPPAEPDVAPKTDPATSDPAKPTA